MYKNKYNLYEEFITCKMKIGNTMCIETGFKVKLGQH